MALDYELQSRKLLILFTSVRRWYLSKAMMSVWGHQFFHKYPFNTLICKQLLLTDDVGVYSMVYKQCEYLWLKGGFCFFEGMCQWTCNNIMRDHVLSYA